MVIELIMMDVILNVKLNKDLHVTIIFVKRLNKNILNLIIPITLLLIVYI